MVCPILQLKVSRLRHNKHHPDKGDYFQARCDGDGKLYVFQLIKRIDGMLSAQLMNSQVRLRFCPDSLRGKQYRELQSSVYYEIYSAERPPLVLLQHIHDLPVGADRLDIITKWFAFSEPYINSINEFL